jgi:hypothetical protein
MWAKQGPPQNIVDEVMARIGVKCNTNDTISVNNNQPKNVSSYPSQDKTSVSINQSFEQNVKYKMTEFLNDRLNNLENIMSKHSISELGSSKMS